MDKNKNNARADKKGVAPTAPTLPAPHSNAESDGSAHEYGWYMAGQGLFFLAGGIGFVLNNWLIVFYLREPPEIAGPAQMLMTLPQLLFVLFGGLSADRAELRSHLIRLQSLMVVPMLGLVLVILTGHLNWQSIVGLTFVGGTIGAFIQPARDSLLTRVTSRLTDRSIQQSIMTANMLQFGTQIFGIILVRFVAIIGPVPLILMQAGIYASGVLTTTRLSAYPPIRRSDGRGFAHQLHEIWDGLKESFSSPEIRPVMMWVLASGFITMGVYMIVLPFIVRDIYQGDAPEVTTMHACFFVGVTISSFFLSKWAHFRHQGRALLLSQMFTVVVMFTIHLNPPEFLFFFVIFCWGLSGAIGMSMTRSIVQQAAPATHRARILSVLLLFNFGGAPIGALLSGILVKALGPLDAVLVAATCSFLLVTTFTLFSGLWTMQTSYSRTTPQSD